MADTAIASGINLMIALYNLKKELDANWEDCKALISRCEVFQNILFDAQKLSSTKMKEMESSFDDLVSLLENVHTFTKKYTDSAISSFMTRLIFRRGKAEEMCKLNIHLDRCIQSFHLDFVLTAEINRERDLEVSNENKFDALIKTNAKTLNDGNEANAKQLTQLQQDVSDFTSSINEILTILKHQPLSNTELVSLEKTMETLSSQLARQHEEIMSKLCGIASQTELIPHIGEEVHSLSLLIANLVKTNSDSKGIEIREQKLNKLKKNADVLTIEKEIGKGAFASVHIGYMNNSAKVAIKKLSLNNYQVNKSFIQLVHNEILIMDYLNHPNVIKCYGFCEFGEKEMWICLDYAPYGSLDSFMNLLRTNFPNDIPPTLVLAFVKDISAALSAIHDEGIEHRDIKAENVLVFGQLNLKLADFGLAKQQAISIGSRSSPGTEGYTAPEIILRKGSCKSSDIYSLAMTFVQLATGNHPDVHIPLKNMISNAVQNLHISSEFQIVMDMLKDLFTDCCKYIENVLPDSIRPTANEVNSKLSKIIKMLGDDPRGKDPKLFEITQYLDKIKFEEDIPSKKEDPIIPIIIPFTPEELEKALKEKEIEDERKRKTAEETLILHEEERIIKMKEKEALEKKTIQIKGIQDIKVSLTLKIDKLKDQQMKHEKQIIELLEKKMFEYLQKFKSKVLFMKSTIISSGNISPKPKPSFASSSLLSSFEISSFYKANTLVWIKNKEKSCDTFVPARLFENFDKSKHNTIKIYKQSHEVYSNEISFETRSVKDLPENPADIFCSDDVQDYTISDLINISSLNERSILHILRIRFAKDLIYTNISSILISVNPFKRLDLYSDKFKAKFFISNSDDNYILEDDVTLTNSEKLKLKSHIYAISREAYRNMLLSKSDKQMLKKKNQLNDSENNQDVDLKFNKNQSILFSGISGAGKTEATKAIMRYLSYCSTKNSASSFIKGDVSKTSLEEQLVKANEIFEAFGNSKTVRNDNSSRFGKMISIYFDDYGDGVITGGEVDTFLLETSRVTTHAEGERNYHIFYMLLTDIYCNGSLSNICQLNDLFGNGVKKSQIDLSKFTEFKYLCCNCTSFSDSINKRLCAGPDFLMQYKKQSSEFGKAMEALGFLSFESRMDIDKLNSIISELELNQKELENLMDELNDRPIIKVILSIVAGILYFGNVEFLAEGDNQDVECTIADIAPLSQACKLWGINMKKLKPLLLRKVVDARNGVVRYLSKDEAYKNLNSIAKKIYGELFLSIVSQINAKLSQDSNPNSSDKSIAFKRTIALLDIFGFENFKINSLEQLCINYCNETLQRFFNKNFFEMEKKLYEQEDIPIPKKLDFEKHNNVSILELIVGNDIFGEKLNNITTETTPLTSQSKNLVPQTQAIGIFGLCDEEVKVKRGNDIHLLQEIRKVYGEKRPTNSRNENRPPKLFDSCEMLKGNKNCFGIKHYVYDSTIHYTIDDFVKKNADKLDEEILAVLERSTSSYFQSVVTYSVGLVARTTTNNRKPRTDLTLCNKFKKQVESLMIRLKSTQSNFVRCLKPISDINDSEVVEGAFKLPIERPFENSGLLVRRPTLSRQPSETIHNNLDVQTKIEFHSDCMLEQLRCAGLVGVCEIRKEGYSNRMTSQQFSKRYHFLCTGTELLKLPKIIPPSLNSMALVENIDAREIISVLKERKKSSVLFADGYAMGKTTVFLRHSQFEALESAYYEVYAAVKKVELYYRVHLLKRKAKLFNAVIQARKSRSVPNLKSSILNLQSTMAVQLSSDNCTAIAFLDSLAYVTAVISSALNNYSDYAQLQTSLNNFQTLSKDYPNYGVNSGYDGSYWIDPRTIDQLYSIICKQEIEKKLTYDLQEEISNKHKYELIRLIAQAKEISFESDDVTEATILLNKIEKKEGLFLELNKSMKINDFKNIKILCNMAKAWDCFDSIEVQQAELYCQQNEPQIIVEPINPIVRPIEPVTVEPLEEEYDSDIDIKDYKDCPSNSPSQDSESDVEANKLKLKTLQNCRVINVKLNDILKQITLAKNLNDVKVEDKILLNSLVLEADKLCELSLQDPEYTSLQKSLRDTIEKSKSLQNTLSKKIMMTAEMFDEWWEEFKAHALGTVTISSSSESSSIHRVYSRIENYSQLTLTAGDTTEWSTFLSCQKKDLSKSLTYLSSIEESELAREMFGYVLSYMEDNSSSASSTLQYSWIAQQVLIIAINYPSLRNEAFLQIIKQLNNNNYEVSFKRGWMLLCICLDGFTPVGEEFSKYLFYFLNSCWKSYNGVVDDVDSNTVINIAVENTHRLKKLDNYIIYCLRVFESKTRRQCMYYFHKRGTLPNVNFKVKKSEANQINNNKLLFNFGEDPIANDRIYEELPLIFNEIPDRTAIESYEDKHREPVVIDIYAIDGTIQVRRLPVHPNLTVEDVLSSKFESDTSDYDVNSDYQSFSNHPIFVSDVHVDLIGLYIYEDDTMHNNNVDDGMLTVPFSPVAHIRPLRKSDYLCDAILQKRKANAKKSSSNNNNTNQKVVVKLRLINRKYLQNEDFQNDHNYMNLAYKQALYEAFYVSNYMNNINHYNNEVVSSKSSNFYNKKTPFFNNSLQGIGTLSSYDRSELI
eukprot:gene10085-13552_t